MLQATLSATLHAAGAETRTDLVVFGDIFPIVNQLKFQQVGYDDLDFGSF
jgi:hypothetical protein